MPLLVKAMAGVLGIMQMAILARILISWIPVPRENALIRILYQVTEPLLAPIRSLIERSALGKNMMFDFAPLLALLIIELLKNILGY